MTGRRFFASTIRSNVPAILPFISTWNTVNTSTGSSASNQIKLPLINSASYDFTVNWGDGTSDIITAWDQPEVTHTYPSAGLYTISITGNPVLFYFFGATDRLKITNISSFGGVCQIGFRSFYNCTNLDITATDLPDFNVLTESFFGCTSLVFNSSIESWDVSSQNTLQGLFRNCILFNQDISGWDVSNVTTFRLMFAGAAAFNQPIGIWNVIGANNISSMFNGASSFNQDISGWNVSNVTTLRNTFTGASSFNQDISGWNVSNCTDFRQTFWSAITFNQPIGSWSFGTANCQEMLLNTTNFDQSLAGWNINGITSLSNFKTGANLSTANYDATLVSWAAQTPVIGLTARFALSKYTNSGAALAARNTLISTYGWAITDGGPA